MKPSLSLGCLIASNLLVPHVAPAQAAPSSAVPERSLVDRPLRWASTDQLNPTAIPI